MPKRSEPDWRRILPIFVGLALTTGCSSIQSWTLGAKEEEHFQATTPSIPKNVKLSPPKKIDPTPEMLVDFGGFHLGLKHYSRAADYFDQALELDDRCVPAYLGRAQMHKLAGEPEKAIELLLQATARLPKSADLWNELGVIQAENGDLSGAIASVQKALKRAPRSELFTTNLAGMLAVAGRYQESYETYCQVLPRAEAHYRVAGVLYQQGYREESVRQLQLAVSTNPNHAKSAEMLSRLADNSVQPVGYFDSGGRNELQSRQRY